MARKGHAPGYGDEWAAAVVAAMRDPEAEARARTVGARCRFAVAATSAGIALMSADDTLRLAVRLLGRVPETEDDWRDAQELLRRRREEAKKK